MSIRRSGTPSPSSRSQPRKSPGSLRDCARKRRSSIAPIWCSAVSATRPDHPGIPSFSPASASMTTKLPRILEPWDIVGSVTAQGAAQTGLLEGTPIAAGCGDQAANVLGAGIVEPGMIYDAAGTASIFAIVLDSFATDTAHKTLMTSSHVVPGRFFAMAYLAGGGLNTRWFRDEICGQEREAWAASGQNAYEALGALADAIPPGAEKLVFLPHLGGRNTPNDPDMRGGFLGLTWAHRKSHMYRAILESIGYEYALYLLSVRAISPTHPADGGLQHRRGCEKPHLQADQGGHPGRGLPQPQSGRVRNARIGPRRRASRRAFSGHRGDRKALRGRPRRRAATGPCSARDLSTLCRPLPRIDGEFGALLPDPRQHALRRQGVRGRLLG